MLQVDVKEILADAQEHSAYTALHKEDIQTCAALTQSLEAVAAASTALEAAEEAILGPDLIAACDSLTVLHSAMAALPSEKNEIGAGAVCQVLLVSLFILSLVAHMLSLLFFRKVLRNTTSLAQGRFQSRLRRLLEHAVQVHRGRIQVRIAILFPACGLGIILSYYFSYVYLTILDYEERSWGRSPRGAVAWC